MAVAFDAVGPSSAGAAATGTTTVSWSHTCTGSDLLLIVGVALGNATDTGLSITGVTYNSVAMTSVGLIHSNNSTAGFIQMFRLINPSTGANTVQVNTNGSANDLAAGSVSFTGVDQTTPLGTPVTGASNGTAPSVAVTGTTAGNMVVDTACNGASITSSNQTQRWLRNINTSTAAGNAASSTAAAGGSVTMSYAVTTDWWGAVAVEVLAASGGAAARRSVDITPLTATAWVTGTTPVSATYPTVVENDIVYLICSSKPGGTAPTTPTNWTLVGSTQVGSGTAGIGTGPTQVTVFRRVVPSGGLSGTQAVALTGANVMSVCMHAYRATGTNLQWETETWNTGSAAASATPAIAVTVAASAFDAKDVVGWVVSVTDDTATAITHTSETLTGITFGTDVRAPNATAADATGQDIASAAFYVPITAGPNSGTTLTLTENITAAETSGAGVWRIRATEDILEVPREFLVRPLLAAIQRATW